MIMKKKNLILAATAAAMIAAMTGCSGGAEETTAAETTAAETTAAETEAEETEETTAAEAEETEAAGEETEAAGEAGAENGTLEAVANMSADGELAQIIEAGKIVLGTSPDFAPWEFQDCQLRNNGICRKRYRAGKIYCPEAGRCAGNQAHGVWSDPSGSGVGYHRYGDFRIRLYGGARRSGRLSIPITRIRRPDRGSLY